MHRRDGSVIFGFGRDARADETGGYIDRRGEVPVYRKDEECMRCLYGLGTHSCWRRGVQMGKSSSVQSEFTETGDSVHSVSKTSSAEAREEDGSER